MRQHGRHGTKVRTHLPINEKTTKLWVDQLCALKQYFLRQPLLMAQKHVQQGDRQENYYEQRFIHSFIHRLPYSISEYLLCTTWYFCWPFSKSEEIRHRSVIQAPGMGMEFIPGNLKKSLKHIRFSERLPFWVRLGKSCMATGTPPTNRLALCKERLKLN